MADAPQYALVTGPISGRIPTPDPAVEADFVNVTPDVLFFDSQEEVLRVADAIEDEHWARDTHPIQEQCRELDSQPDISDEEREQHRALHAEIRARVEPRIAQYGSVE